MAEPAAEDGRDVGTGAGAGLGDVTEASVRFVAVEGVSEAAGGPLLDADTL